LAKNLEPSACGTNKKERIRGTKMQRLLATANLWRRMPTGTPKKELHLRRSSVDLTIFPLAVGNYIKFRKEKIRWGYLHFLW